MFIPKKEPSLLLLKLHPPGCEERSEEYDPVDVFDEIFSFTDLNGLRRELWEIFKAAIKDKHTYDTTVRRSNLFFIYSALHDVITAAYIILKKREDEKECSNQTDNSNHSS